MAPTLLLLGLGGVILAIATRKRTPSADTWMHGPVQTTPPCKTWLTACSVGVGGPCYNVTPAVRAIADQIRAMDEAHGNVWPLGKTYFYEIVEGGMYRFRVELHGPNTGNPSPHRGVGVTKCSTWPPP